MKRIWLGLAVLTALLGVGLWGMCRTNAIHGQIARQLSHAAGEKNAQKAFAAGEKAGECWEKHHLFTAAIADHTDMDEIDRLFAQLAVCRQQQDLRQHAQVCAILSEYLRAIAENHALRLGNILQKAPRFL